jgi:hypothetical protein
MRAGFSDVPTVWHERGGEARYARSVSRFLARHRDRLDRRVRAARSSLRREPAQPLRGDRGIRKVRFVEHLQARPLTVQAQLVDHRIATRARQACVDHLDHDVDAGHRFGGFFARRRHMAGKPVDRHSRQSCCPPAR